jgi:hypothetical protein
MCKKLPDVRRILYAFYFTVPLQVVGYSNEIKKRILNGKV